MTFQRKTENQLATNSRIKNTHQMIIRFHSSGILSSLLLSKILIKEAKKNSSCSNSGAFTPKNVFITPFPFSGCRGFSTGVNPTGFESLVFPPPLPSDEIFLIQEPKMLKHSCPTAALSYTGHCPLPFPVILVSVVHWCSRLLLLFLSWRRDGRYGEVLVDWWKDGRKKLGGREPEKQRESAYVKTAQKHWERQRKQPAHVHEADGVSV